MALEREDVKLLNYPFPAKAHKFVTDMPYLHEEAINDRLDMVDPSWEIKLNRVERRANAGEGGKDVGTVWVHVTMTVKGVSRDAIGMAVIQQTNPQEIKRWNDNTKKNEGTGTFYTSEANEAEKSATTDALKRAARMFGVGRYLLAIPKVNSKSAVTNAGQMEKWLKDTFGEIRELSLYYNDSEESPASLEIDDYIPPSNVTSISAWSEADIKKFWKRWNGNEQIASADILKALGVTKLSEWTKSLGDANAAMQKYLNEAESA